MGNTHDTPIFRKDRYLSTAVITTEIEYLLRFRNNPRALKKEHRDLLEYLGKMSATIHANFISWTMIEWRNLGFSTRILAGLTTAMRVAQHATKVSVLDYRASSCNK